MGATLTTPLSPRRTSYPPKDHSHTPHHFHVNTNLNYWALPSLPQESQEEGTEVKPEAAIGAAANSSHYSKRGSIPSRVAPRFSCMGIMLDNADGLPVFSGISYFPRPCIPALLHTHLASHSSALKNLLVVNSGTNISYTLQFKVNSQNTFCLGVEILKHSEGISPAGYSLTMHQRHPAATKLHISHRHTEIGWRGEGRWRGGKERGGERERERKREREREREREKERGERKRERKRERERERREKEREKERGGERGRERERREKCMHTSLHEKEGECTPATSTSSINVPDSQPPANRQYAYLTARFPSSSLSLWCSCSLRHPEMRIVCLARSSVARFGGTAVGGSPEMVA
ncbi:hypothetical protein PR048_001424 [Dryococelus australis]|uniref:Uncharacterized protein n=1 Tax=Dryococelus australis TaxID=614101 RepID=A0ABQ9IHE7_9NEOP|nr:hypothetical protein PR048_001424 [Dryococelus australis]